MSTTDDSMEGGAAGAEDAPWSCPVCNVDVPHPFGPGRKRVYCTPACKQRAYRWRRRHGVRKLATPWLPAERSGLLTTHAVRPAADFVGHRADEHGRHAAVCGAFARRVDSALASHTEFVPGGRRACHSCTRLIGADPAWAVDYPPGAVRYVEGRWDWVPISTEERRIAFAQRSTPVAA